MQEALTIHYYSIMNTARNWFNTSVNVNVNCGLGNGQNKLEFEVFLHHGSFSKMLYEYYYQQPAYEIYFESIFFGLSVVVRATNIRICGK